MKFQLRNDLYMGILIKHFQVMPQDTFTQTVVHATPTSGSYGLFIKIQPSSAMPHLGYDSESLEMEMTISILTRPLNNFYAQKF